MPVEKVFTRSLRRSLSPKYVRRSPARSFQSGRLCSFDCSQRFSQAEKSSSRMTSDATQPIRCFTCIGSQRTLNPRSEERRVGKEGRSRWLQVGYTKTKSVIE